MTLDKVTEARSTLCYKQVVRDALHILEHYTEEVDVKRPAGLYRGNGGLWYPRNIVQAYDAKVKKNLHLSLLYGALENKFDRLEYDWLPIDIRDLAKECVEVVNQFRLTKTVSRLPSKKMVASLQKRIEEIDLRGTDEQLGADAKLDTSNLPGCACEICTG